MDYKYNLGYYFNNHPHIFIFSIMVTIITQLEL